MVYRERMLWCLEAFVAVVGILFMPSEMYPGDPVAVREETRSILLRGALAVTPSVADHYAATQEPGQFVVDNPKNGRTYSKYGSMLAVAYLLPMAIEWFVEGELPHFTSARRPLYLNAFNILLSILLAASLYRTSRRLGVQPWVTAVFVGSCFYTTFLWNYLRVQNSEIFQLLCFSWAVSGFLDVLDARRQSRADWAAVLRLWLACNALLLTRLSYVFVGPCFAAGLLWERIASGNEPPFEAAIRELRCHIIPALAGVACLAAFNAIKFGSPWLSGYHAWERGQSLDRLFGGNLFPAVYDLTFGVQWGLPYLFPVLWLAVPSIAAWIRKHPREYGTILLVLAVSTVIVASRNNWRGEATYGPRYWLFIAPFAALPATQTIAWLAAPNWRSRLTAAATILVLWHSTSEQLAVNRHGFFTFYNLRAPLEKSISIEAAMFFTNQSYGHIIAEMEQKFPDGMEWWKQMRPQIQPDIASGYEQYVREVLGKSNLYWFP